MKFERGKDPKEALRVGKYSNIIVVEEVVHEVHGGQTLCMVLPNSIAEMFLEALSEGIRVVPTDIRLPNGLPREEYRLDVRYQDGSRGNHSSAGLEGMVLQDRYTGTIYKIPEKLETKTYKYEF